jgi:hypothetical protein
MRFGIWYLIFWYLGYKQGIGEDRSNAVKTAFAFGSNRACLPPPPSPLAELMNLRSSPRFFEGHSTNLCEGPSTTLLVTPPATPASPNSPSRLEGGGCQMESRIAPKSIHSPVHRTRFGTPDQWCLRGHAAHAAPGGARYPTDSRIPPESILKSSIRSLSPLFGRVMNL